MSNAFALSNSGAVPAQYNPNSTYAKNISGISIQNPSQPATNSGLVGGGATANSPVKTTPGMLPTTPVKSIATADGTTTTFHPPEANTSSKTASASTTAPAQAQASAPQAVPQPVQPQGAYDTTTGLLKQGYAPRGVPNGTADPSALEAQQAGIVSQQPSAQQAPQTLNQSVVTALANSGTAPGTAYTNAQGQYNQDVQNLKSFQQSVADKNKAIMSTPGILGQAIGQEANIGQANAAQEAALQGAITADTNVLGAANTQQQTQQSALNEAAGFTQPQSQFGLLTNPQTGQPLNAQLVQGAVQTAIGLVNDGASVNDPQVQALISPFGFLGAEGLNQAQQAIAQSQGTTYNPTTQAAGAQAQASNVGTEGTASTQVAASGYASTLPVYQQASTDFTTADQQAGNLLKTLSDTGINSTNATDYNTTINGLATKLGSTQTTAFTTALTEAQQAYTKLLSSVGAATPTVNGEAATSVLSPSSTPAQIAESIDKLNQAAYAKLAPQYQQALTYYNQLHGTDATEIPGYPAPVLPSPVSKGPPQGPDTSAGNLAKEGAGSSIGAVKSFVGSGIGEAIIGYLTGGLVK